MKKTPRETAKAQQVREKRAPYVRAPRAKAPSTQRSRADAHRRAPTPEQASRTIELHGTRVPDDVVQFCEREGILNYLLVADELVAECFPDASDLRVEMQEDPETGEKAAVLRLTVAGSTDELLDRADKYTTGWVKRVPWPHCTRISISYDVIQR